MGTGEANREAARAEGRIWPVSAVERAKNSALEWLEGEDGYPRSWEQEDANTVRRGYEQYDDFEAPPIAGYEALERDGLVTRLETVTRSGEERIHFTLKLEQSDVDIAS